jgi:hypothetical protein
MNPKDNETRNTFQMKEKILEVGTSSFAYTRKCRRKSSSFNAWLYIGIRINTVAELHSILSKSSHTENAKICSLSPSFHNKDRLAEREIKPIYISME